jgi:hypothetical protein
MLHKLDHKTPERKQKKTKERTSTTTTIAHEQFWHKLKQFFLGLPNFLKKYLLLVLNFKNFFNKKLRIRKFLQHNKNVFFVIIIINIIYNHLCIKNFKLKKNGMHKF